MESSKNLEQKLIFQIGTPLNPHAAINERFSFNSFIRVFDVAMFFHSLKSKKQLVRLLLMKQYHGKVLLHSFQQEINTETNDHTLRFDEYNEKLEPPCVAKHV